MQFNIFDTHQTENNPASQQHLDENRTHFNKQCQKVYNMLMDKEILTVRNALINDNIHSLPRRILDLKKQGVMISDDWDRDVKPPIKYWYMTQKDILDNTRKFI